MRGVLCVLLLVVSAFAQTTVINGPGGGSVDLSGVPAGALLSNQSGAVGGSSNLLFGAAIAAPVTPSISTVGTAGSTRWDYCITALAGYGETACSTTASILTGSATLDGSNNNHISWAAVGGANGYLVYRKFAGGTPSTLGFLPYQTSDTFFDDTGIAANGIAPPTQNLSNVISASGLAVGTALSNLNPTYFRSPPTGPIGGSFSVKNGRQGVFINADTSGWGLYSTNTGGFPQGIESDVIVTEASGRGYSMIALPMTAADAALLVGVSVEAPSFYNDNLTVSAVHGVEIQDMSCNIGISCATTDSAGIFVMDQSGGHAIQTGLGSVEFGDTVKIPALHSTTGTRFVCVDTAGNLTSSTTACSGT